MTEFAKPSLSVVGSCESSEIALNELTLPNVDKSAYGVFTARVLNGISEGQSFLESIKSLVGNKISIEAGSQIPVISGDELSPELLQREKMGSGVFIHVAGATKKNEEPSIFTNERRELANYFKTNNYDCISVDSFQQYREAIKTSLDLNEGKDIAIIYFSGHAAYMLAKTNPGATLASSTLPDIGNKPLREGVFYFSAKEQNPEFKDYDRVLPVHEAEIMQEIKTLKESNKFKHILVVFDTCSAGAFDAEQFINETPKEIPKINSNNVYSSRR